MLRTASATLLLGYACLAAGCQVKFNPPPPPKGGAGGPGAPAAPVGPAVVVSAQKLAGDFTADPEGAFKRYAQHPVQVEGVVAEHQAARGGVDAVVFHVTSGDPQRPWKVICRFQDPIMPTDWLAPRLAVGRAIILRGRLFMHSGKLITIEKCGYIADGGPAAGAAAPQAPLAPPGPPPQVPPAAAGQAPVVILARKLAQDLDNEPEEAFRRYVPRTLNVVGVVSRVEKGPGGAAAAVTFKVKVRDRKTSLAKPVTVDCRFANPVPAGDERLAVGKRVVVRGKLTGHSREAAAVTLNECALLSGRPAVPPPQKAPPVASFPPPGQAGQPGPAGPDAAGAEAVKQLGGFVEYDKPGPGQRVVKAHLYGGKIQGADLARLKALPELRELYVGGVTITGKGLERLKGLDKLEKLNLVNCKLDGADLAPLRDLPALRALNLSQTGVTDRDLEPLRGLTRLEELELLNDPITDRGLENIKDLTRLRVLVLPAGKQRGVTDAGLALLKGLTELRKLSLSFNCTDKGLEQLQAFRKLERLELFGHQYTDRGLAHLEGLPELRELKAFATGIAGEGLAKLKGLRLLDLDRCPVSKKGLANLPALEGLEVLGVTNTKFGDADLDYVTGLKNLRELRLYGTQITDAGLPKLAALPNLRQVLVGQTQVTNAGIQGMVRRMPKVSWSR